MLNTKPIVDTSHKLDEVGERQNCSVEVASLNLYIMIIYFSFGTCALESICHLKV